MLKLALRNLLRQKSRTAITLAAVAFGVAGLIVSAGFVRDIIAQLGEAVIHSRSGHLQVNRSGFFAQGTRSPENYLIDDPAALRTTIRGIAGVDDVMARVGFSGLANNGRADVAIIGEGIEPEREAKLGSFLHISAGRQLEARDTFGALVGHGVAVALALKPGDRFTLLTTTTDGAMNTLDLQVVGVFQSFSKDFDARAVRIPLAAAQELLGTPGINTLVVALHSTADTNAAANALATRLDPARYEIKTWIELNDFYSSAVQLYDRQFGVLRLVVLLMVLLSVANSVNMSMFERVPEFGTMRALGNRARHVFTLVVTESLLLGVAGALIGAVVGALVAVAISAVGIQMPPPPNADLGYTARILLAPADIGVAMLVGVVATVLASLFPARSASRVPIVDALREAI
ncbi:MAG: FtsX-like permease family protein [Casimicrobiaceae bacterium]